MFSSWLCIIKGEERTTEKLQCFSSTNSLVFIQFVSNGSQESRTSTGRSPLHRPRRGCSGGDRHVVEWMVEKVALVGPMNYPLLSKINYNDWALLRHALLGSIRDVVPAASYPVSE
jgi:hypothetical protein